MRGRIAAVVVAVVVSFGTTSSAAGAAPEAGSIWNVNRIRAAAHAFRMNARSSAARTSAAGPVPVMTVHDPVGDVPFAPGDITGAGFAQNATSFAFGVTVAAPTDPSTDPNWQNGLVFVGWALDTNNDGLPEDIVFLTSGPTGGLVAFLASSSSAKTCNGTGSFIAGSGYRATFPNNCLTPGLQFRMQSAMSYTNDPNDQNPPLDIAPDSGWSAPFVTTNAAGPTGYWMLGADGRVYPFGGAVGFPGVVPHAMAMAPRKDGRGYWIVDRSGYVVAYGAARSFGGSPPLRPGEFIKTISATPAGDGYWLFSNDGRVFAFGNAANFGDMSGTHLNGAIIASVATPTGHGYYMVGSDGGIFTFGDARFRGSVGGMRLNRPVVGMSPTPNGRGYWLVAADGGAFAFDAPFRGSMGAAHLNQPVDGLVAFGNGYLMGAADGGVFDFSNEAFVGSLAEDPPSAPIIGIASFTRK